MEYEQIAIDVEDRCLTITLDRPDRLNAFTFRMHRELVDAFDRADADDDIRVVIVTGRGDRGFCAGADLRDGKTKFSGSSPPEASRGGGVSERPAVPRDAGGLVTLRIFQCTKPVIGAINGAAIGVGATMTLPMDIRVAASNARFGFVFAKRGIVPEAASSWFLPRIVGISKAAEWSFTGRIFSAEEALAGGLVSYVVPGEELLAKAKSIAAEISENTSAVSVALARQMMWRMLGEPHPMGAHRIDSAVLASLTHSGDVAEGVASFAEKRPPQFRDRVTTDLPAVYPWWTEPEF